MRVKLIGVPHEKKIQAIKGVRAASGLGLKEAKDAVDATDLGGTPVIDVGGLEGLRWLDEHGVTYQSMHIPVAELAAALRDYPAAMTVGDLRAVLTVAGASSKDD